MSPQAKYHLCSAGWLDGGRVGYPTSYASQNCGSGVVGIVDYGPRNNKSEMWDVFCYRMKGNGSAPPQSPGPAAAKQSSAWPARVLRGDGAPGPLPHWVGPRVLLPSRCELHLQGRLRGRRLLVQRESAAGPDVPPLAHGLPGGTYHVCLPSPQGGVASKQVSGEPLKEGRDSQLWLRAWTLSHFP